MMRISLITTVFNEEKTIGKFLESIFSQTRLPDEIIIVDGGSRDTTVESIKKKVLSSKKKNSLHGIEIITLVKPGNRSVGRNEAIKHAKGEVIVCTDAGNVLDKNWIENVTKPFGDSSRNNKGGRVDVVAGYYQGLAKNIFQKCLIPYALVMPDKVNPQNFLPATRSLAFKKTIWEKVGGFDEEYSHNEDYVFARKLKKANARIVFAKDAIVYWIPRSTFKQAFVMFFRFAFGDAEADILRSKVLLLFARYLFVSYLLFLSFLYRSIASSSLIILLFGFYLVWSVKKKYRYVNDKKAFIFLPSLQFTADAAVLSGTIGGLLKRAKQFNLMLFIKQNKFLLLIVFLYSLVVLSLLQWGIPNGSRPYPFHMDEWHQLHAVATTFKNGTPNIAGSANGTMFHFLVSGFYLAPFVVLHIVNPFHLTVDDITTKIRLFEILRLNTLLFGILSLFVVWNIAKRTKLSTKLTLFLFACTPIWLSLSNYFKYDIALIFWILLSILFILRFSKDPSNRNFIIAAIPVGLSVAVKISALPLVMLYLFSYFLFTFSKKRDYRFLLIGVAVIVGCILFFGMPDMLFGRGNIYDYFYTNVIQSPHDASNFQLHSDPYKYLLFHDYPIIFGSGVLLLFAYSLLYWFFIFFKKGFSKSIQQYKYVIFFFSGLFIFAISLLPLQVWAAGNRSLVLLPFLVFIIGKALYESFRTFRLKVLVLVLIIVASLLQVYDSYAILSIKFAPSPQEVSSLWIQKHISQDQVIGIENIPVYQLLPDIVLQEFYYSQNHISQHYLFSYQVVSAETKKLPSIVVITNDSLEARLYQSSPKKNLVTRLRQEGYKKVATFSPYTKFYSLLGNDIDYYFSGLVAAPYTISIYRK